MKIEITRKERKEIQPSISAPRGAKHIDICTAVVSRGPIRSELLLSRYSTEQEWYVDAQINNMLPLFCHGEGSRCCRKQAAQAELLEAIEAAPIKAS
jgi:hypothetical protein